MASNASNSSVVHTVDTLVCKSKLLNNDTVFKFDKNGRIKFGVVAETNDDNSDYTDESQYDSLQLGDDEVCVVWYPDGLEEVIEKQNVQLAHRSIEPNNFVRRITPGNDSQTGYCIESHLSADVEIKGKSVVLKNVACSRLHRLMEEGDWISFDSLIGITKVIQLKLLLKTHCGDLVEVLTTSNDVFKLYDPNMKNRYVNFPSNSFVGQTLVGFNTSLKNGKWITPKPSFRNGQKITSAESSKLQSSAIKRGCNLLLYARENILVGSKEALLDILPKKSTERYMNCYDAFIKWLENNGISFSFVVQSVELDAVWVKWQLNMETLNSETNSDNSCITGDDLKRIKRLYSKQQYDRQIGDTDLLKVTEGDLLNATSKTQWKKQCSIDLKNEGILWGKTIDGNKESIEIVKSTSICETLDCNSKNEEDDDDGWQTADDDSWQTDDSSSELSHCVTASRSQKNQQNNMKLPDEAVINSLPINDDVITVEIILIRSQVTVIWEDGTVESGISPTHLITIDTDEGEFSPRNYVVVESEAKDLSSRNYGVVQKVNRNERTAIVKWFRAYTEGMSEPQFVNENEASLYDLKFHPDFYFRLHCKVTRFVNFDDKNEKNTIGRVIHVDTDGRVKVEWIDGNHSTYWPQDLIIMSESHYLSSASLYSSSEEAEIQEILTERQIEIQCDYFIEKFKDGYEALRSLETSLQHSPINNEKVMDIKNKCSLIDRLMSTSFFDFEIKTSNIVKSPTKSLIPNSAESSSVENTMSKEFLEKTQSNQDLDKSHDSGNHSKNEEENFGNTSSVDSTIKTVDGSNIDSVSIDLFNVTSNLNLLRVNLGKALDEMKKRFQDTVSESVNVAKQLEVNEDKIHNSEDAATLTDIANNTTNINPLCCERFVVLEIAPTSHRFKSTTFNPSDSQQFHRAVKHDHEILLTSLPPGVWVKVYEDRMDLLSVAIIGPKGTPYEDGIFMFDFQLSKNYPHTPPACHYVSLSSHRLNPNLYEIGKVCISLLGTWTGEGSELWGPGCTLLQVIVSIQGLILNSEPFFNEAGYEKRIGTEDGHKESEMYNEIVVIRLVETMTKLVTNPPEVFRDEILQHFRQCGDSMYQRITGWMEKTNEPEFPLVASRGFCLKIVDLLAHFRSKIDAINKEL